ncbi:hypothetical protein SALBM135S_07337 [Streptomyces alboniger]
MLPLDSLPELNLPIGDDGVVIGVDADSRPAVLGVNRPTPYDMVFIGGLWTAQVIALRAAATGARVAVETGRAGAWERLAQALGVGQSGMAVHDVVGALRRGLPRGVRCSSCGTAGCGRPGGGSWPGPGSPC